MGDKPIEIIRLLLNGRQEGHKQNGDMTMVTEPGVIHSEGGKKAKNQGILGRADSSLESPEDPVLQTP